MKGMDNKLCIKNLKARRKNRVKCRPDRQWITDPNRSCGKKKKKKILLYYNHSLLHTILFSSLRTALIYMISLPWASINLKCFLAWLIFFSAEKMLALFPCLFQCLMWNTHILLYLTKNLVPLCMLNCAHEDLETLEK